METRLQQLQRTSRAPDTTGKPQGKVLKTSDDTTRGQSDKHSVALLPQHLLQLVYALTYEEGGEEEDGSEEQVEDLMGDSQVETTTVEGTTSARVTEKDKESEEPTTKTQGASTAVQMITSHLRTR